MRAGPATPALVRRAQRAVEDHVSREPVGRGPTARFQRWGRRRSSRFRTLVLLLGFALPGLTALALQALLPAWGTGGLVAVAIGSFGVAMSGVEGRSRWFRVTDRLVATVPRGVIVLTLVTGVLAWATGVVLVWGESSNGVELLISSVTMLVFAFAFSASVFTVDRARPHVGFSTMADTVARLVALVSALLVPMWIGTRGDERETTSALVAGVLAIIGVFGVAFLRALARRRTVLTLALVASDDLCSALSATTLDGPAVLSAAHGLDRALATRLTSGFRPISAPLADSRSRATLLSTVHALLRLPESPSDDEVVTVMREGLASADPDELRRELSDYCLHLRAVLHTRADLAALV